MEDVTEEEPVRPASSARKVSVSIQDSIIAYEKLVPSHIKQESNPLQTTVRRMHRTKYGDLIPICLPSNAPKGPLPPEIIGPYRRIHNILNIRHSINNSITTNNTNNTNNTSNTNNTNNNNNINDHTQEESGVLDQTDNNNIPAKGPSHGLSPGSTSRR